jgi:outer membrane protein assembly factor BamB
MLNLVPLIGAIAIGWNAEAAAQSFAPGDVFVALRTGEVQWRRPDGMLNAVLVGSIQGKVEGLGFDAAGNLYVSHYCADLSVCQTGNSFEKFNSMGIPLGAFGSGYNCNPYSIAFNRDGQAYVGQADCTGSTLKFSATGVLERALSPQWENRGTAWIDLAADGCTLFYTSQGSKVKRFDVCTGAQLPDFTTTLPSVANQLRILGDGGVLVATNDAIVRLNASGAIAQTYDVLGEFRLWYGVALVGDGTFWASNYGSSNVYRFNISTGAVLTSFNAGTPTTTVKGLAVKPGP